MLVKNSLETMCKDVFNAPSTITTQFQHFLLLCPRRIYNVFNKTEMFSAFSSGLYKSPEHQRLTLWILPR